MSRTECDLHSTEKLKFKSQRATEGKRAKRYSHKLLHEYNVETLVVADPAMVSYHGVEAARRFILTVMNMVRIPTAIFNQDAKHLSFHCQSLRWIQLMG